MLTIFQRRCLAVAGLAGTICVLQLCFEGIFAPGQERAASEIHPSQPVPKPQQQTGTNKGSSVLAIPTVPLTRGNLSSRSDRFPSVEERIRLYTASWYLPPCRRSPLPTESLGGSEDYLTYSYNATSQSRIIFVGGRNKKQEGDDGRSTENRMFYEFNTAIQADVPFSLQSDVIRKDKGEVSDYSIDVVETMLPTLHDLGWDIGNVELPPIILQFGDSAESALHGYLPLPVIKKFRHAMSKSKVNQLTKGRDCIEYSNQHDLEPIIWKLQTERHLSRLPSVPIQDIPWYLKFPQAIFRGSLTGRKNRKETDPVKRCLSNARCRLVYENYDSDILDAQLSNTFGFVPDEIGDVHLVSPPKSMAAQLLYKAIIFLEGNDISSGVKWALYSKSVILMPPPTVTSWVMEERLIPWVHYVPIDPELSDVKEKIQWVLDHDEETQLISERATLWMHDLLFHEDAMSDEKKIFREILQRYKSHFVYEVSDKNENRQL